ncbi:MAG TPA: 2Fe-2S iron-sulfur cluster-binding protein, partial [Candidatus Hydrogenedentes bacterium]|nr:2Fe-2S iron-sulfur cluster-binding protein [Candidatus Hydrogenedentota bacterium]
MDARHARITFDPSGRAVETRPGTPLLEAAALAGFAVNTPCGGAGSCGKCRALLDPAPDPLPVELKTLSLEELEAGWRLLCRHNASADLRIHLPSSSLFGGGHQIVTDHD